MNFSFRKTAKNFLPVLEKSAQEIRIRDTLKNKLKENSLSEEDWDQVGQNKTMQTEGSDDSVET